MRQFFLHEFRCLVERRPQQSDARPTSPSRSAIRARSTAPEGRRDFGPRLAQTAPCRGASPRSIAMAASSHR